MTGERGTADHGYMDKNIPPRQDCYDSRRYDPLSHTPEAIVDDFTNGQLFALVALVDALIQTHPRRDTVRDVFLAGREQVMARMLPTAVSDEYIDGIHKVHVLVGPMLGLAADA